MKTLITTILKIFAVATLLLSSAVFADAASFDSNPSDNTGIVSIHAGNNSCNDCGGDDDSVSVNINNPGDSIEITVFTDFMATRGSSDEVRNARVVYETRNKENQSGSSYTFRSTLKAENASSRSDTSRVTGLPNSYKIEYLRGHIENDHGVTDPDVCNSAYDYRVNTSSNIFASGGQYLGDLGNEGGSWCAQGTVVVVYKITNTTTIDIDPVIDLEVDTEGESNITTNSVELEGELASGDDANVWFVLGTSSGLRCSDNSGRYNVSGSYDSGDSFDKYVSGLSADTRYYYRACAEQDGETSEGTRRDFITEYDVAVDPYTYTWQEGDWGACNSNRETRTVQCVRNPGNVPVSSSYCTGQMPDTVRYGCDDGGEDLRVYTRNPSRVYESSARFNGEIIAGETRNVYFVYGTTASEVRCSNGYASKARPTNWELNLSTGDRYFADVSGLYKNREYHYRACATNDGFIAEGSLESFNTGGGSNGGDLPIATTEDERNVEKTSAELNGNINMNSVNDGDVFFVWGTDKSDVENASSENRYNDVRTDGEKIDKRKIRDDFDGEKDFELTVTSLDEDETYYYRICVEYEDYTNKDRLECGLVERFDTDGNSSAGNADVETDSPDIRNNSVTLNGNISNVDEDYLVYFTISETSSVSCENDFPLIVDEVNRSESFELKIEKEILEEDTYHYRACAVNEDGDVISGNRESFTLDYDDSRNIIIQTDNPQSVTQTTAEMCGDLVEDGGSSRKTWFELRPASGGVFTRSKVSQRREGEFCERVSRLDQNTSYLYRACTETKCAPTRTFRTLGAAAPTGTRPVISTLAPTDIRSNYAKLNSYYLGNGASGRCWFNYGRTQSLGKRSNGIYTTSAGAGSCNHNFTGLASGVQYCVQAVIETQYGTDVGSTQCFTTPRVVTTGGPVVVRPVVTVVEEDETEIDLSSLGLGLSLVRLEIDNDEEVVTRGENVEYLIEWENISELDLTDLQLRIEIPQEIQITDTSRGRLDQDTNTIFFTINDLDGADFSRSIPGDRGEMTVSGVVGRGTIGNLLTAEAEIAYDNPVNDAQENARDFDLDEYGAQIAGVTASVFGLANITFLGWLVIVLGLFIIFLVARWLYLEREEMRAQAYLGGGYGGAPRYDNGGYNIPPAGGYQNPVPRYDAPPAPLAAPGEQYNDGYEAYRPNR